MIKTKMIYYLISLGIAVTNKICNMVFNTFLSWELNITSSSLSVSIAIRLYENVPTVQWCSRITHQQWILNAQLIFLSFFSTFVPRFLKSLFLKYPFFWHGSVHTKEVNNHKCKYYDTINTSAYPCCRISRKWPMFIIFFSHRAM